jgi:CheY-like chemotaxis protein
VAAADLHDAIVGLLCAAPQRSAGTTLDAGPARRLAVRGVKVLLAEDNIVNQRVATGLLRKRGHDVTVVGNGADALAALERERFDLVLMDVQMPVMGGLEATVAIRERERRIGGHIRVVAMTAHAMSGDRDRCLAAGMDGYLAKPFDQHHVFAIVEADDPAGADPRPPATPAAFDAAALLEKFGGDREFMEDIVRVFLEDCPAQLSAIESAVEARDPHRIERAAHALKGAAGNLGAADVVRAAADLEQVGATNRIADVDTAYARVTAETSTFVGALRQFEERSRGTSCAP